MLAVAFFQCDWVDRFSKGLSPCPMAGRPHWLRQPLVGYEFIGGQRDLLGTKAAAFDGSKCPSF
jgi:hypothetical protein